MKRFVKCFFELLTQNFSARRETGRKRGAKRACGRSEAVFVDRQLKPLPMNFRICNALKIKPFHALLRNIPFCSLGEVGGAGGRAIDKVDRWNGHKTGIVFGDEMCYIL